jgi:hypothetical protein
MVVSAISFRAHLHWFDLYFSIFYSRFCLESFIPSSAEPLPMPFLVLLILFACAPSSTEETTAFPKAPFSDVAAELGLRKVHTGGGPEKGYIFEAKGGGAAWGDFDSDGDLDLYWVNGATLQAPHQGAGNVLYRNDGKRGFADATAASQTEGKGWGMGAFSADYDNDGHQDIYVTCLGENLLYRNQGNGTFAERARAAGVATPHWSTGAALADYDNDGDLDLYVANYARFDTTAIPRLGTQWKGVDVFVGPLGLEPVADALYRNEGTGTFAEVSALAGLGQVEPGYGFAVLFADYDLDGDPDLYVANDSSPNFLLRNEGNGTFADQALIAQVAYGEMGNAQAGMGASWGDYDNDGWPDLLVTNFEDDYNTLYRNLGNGRFADLSFSAGLGRISLSHVGFGANFLDHDLDGDLDLFVANGHVYPQIERSGTGTTYAQPDHLFANQGNGTFVLSWSSPARLSRGSFAADYDDDGDPDLLVAHLNDRPSLLRNDAGPPHHWLGLYLVGTRSNRDAIGARLELFAQGRVQMRQILCGSSFLGSEDRRALFGLGTVPHIDSLRVYWPSGLLQRFAGLPVNAYLRLEEGEPQAVPVARR